MKRLIPLCLIALGLIASQVSVKAQETGPQGPVVPDVPRGSFPELKSPLSDHNAGSTPLPRPEPKVLKKGILAPAASDVAQHQFLLSQSKTGLMRLLPRETFDWGLKTIPKKVPVRGGGAYFSFHYRSHEYGYGSDISYERGQLQVGFAGADYGMLTDLGDTPLESISAEDPRASFLLNYKPPQKEKDARSEKTRFGLIRTPRGSSGVTIDGVPYQRRVNAVVNHTYLLRSIVYRTSDVLVALRIVSIGEDGGLTIAWKILKEYRPTKLIPD
ncbi:MAG TPA: hypothetical protein VJM50_09100 [Pyrinomonadaceae bacterium]|nr:hypothetical protein [Pyrinomonadaceae bacterium]